VKAFGASRPTVNRALRELQLSGIIERRAGSGSYVRADAVARGFVFGLLIPELGRTEIFEPICRGMAEAQHGSHHALLWGSSLGDTPNIEEQVAQACRQLIAKKVSGVFFAPLELTNEKDTINRRIADVFDKAGIPLVLLDRDLVTYPERSRYDLVGIDNRRAGYTITAHLLKCGCQRVVFIGRPRSAPTVDARIGGYKEAVADASLTHTSTASNQRTRAKSTHPGNRPSRQLRLRERLHRGAPAQDAERSWRVGARPGADGGHR
jgi:DNA-binding LacI/PurR family transcriptional regulator